jgi:hypothetical protein
LQDRLPDGEDGVLQQATHEKDYFMRSVSCARIVLLVVASLLPLQYARAQAPTRMTVCEAADDGCAKSTASFNNVWQFDGTTGRIITPAAGDGSELTIQTMDQTRVIILRKDRTGATAGRTAVYKGAFVGSGNGGSQVEGTVQWDWPDHAGFPFTGTWLAKIQGPAAAPSGGGPGNPSRQMLPSRLLECEGNGPCNSAWQIDGTSGKATWFQQKPVRAELTVIRGAPDDLLIKRTDLTDGNSAVYYGTLRGDTYSGVVVWSSPGHPGSTTGHWSASVPQTQCAANADLSSEVAMRIGQNALMFNLQLDAFNCYIVAAKAGDAMAQTAVGFIYYQGHTGIPQNYPQALFWLRKAAEQGVYAAQKTVADMYMLGEGTPRDAELSRYFGEKAAEQKRDFERRQEREERAADRRANMLTGFVMGAVFGAVFF